MRGAKMIVNSVNKREYLAHKTLTENLHISLHLITIYLMISVHFHFLIQFIIQKLGQLIFSLFWLQVCENGPVITVTRIGKLGITSNLHDFDGKEQ